MGTSISSPSFATFSKNKTNNMVTLEIKSIPHPINLNSIIKLENIQSFNGKSFCLENPENSENKAFESEEFEKQYEIPFENNVSTKISLKRSSKTIMGIKTSANEMKANLIGLENNRETSYSKKFILHRKEIKTGF